MNRAILTYHSIDEQGSPISVSPSSFARHIEFLASDRVNVVPLDEIASCTDSRPTVALTFDDGLESFASHAWPMLRDHGLPCSLFVVTGRVGESNRWNDLASVPDQRLLDWDELGGLAEQGVSLGSHSVTHRDLTTLSTHELRDELSDAIESLVAHSGVEPTSFAYPFGSFNAEVANVTRELYSWGVTTRMALLGKDDPILLPRVDAFYLSAPGRIEAFGRPAFARFVRWRHFLRRLRRWGA